MFKENNFMSDPLYPLAQASQGPREAGEREAWPTRCQASISSRTHHIQ